LEIWNHQIEERLLLFEGSEDQVVDLCRRNHRPNFETIVWLLPEVRYKPTILRLQDLGFRVFCLSDADAPGIPESHLISGISGIRTIIRREILEI
jgi:hypothetical protein